MSSKTLWILLIIAAIALGFIVYLSYFYKIKWESRELVPPEDRESSEVDFPAHERLIVPPPDYSEKDDEEDKEDGSKPLEAEPPPAQPEEVTIIRSGKILESTPEFIKFEAVHLDGSEHIYTALIIQETKIYLVTIPKKATQEDVGHIFERTEIGLDELEVGDQIFITGLAKTEEDYTFNAYKVEKEGYR